jgi:calcineurin-like phosphoesterase family protein
MINIRQTEEQNVYVTSDFHLGHKQTFIYESRGHSSVDEHDNFVIDETNKVVRSTDILFHLGDFCLNTSLPKFEEYLSRINCHNIYMLFGNHPNPHYKNIYLPCIQTYLGGLYEEGIELYPIRYKNIIYIGNYTEITIDNQFVVLCHYPLHSWNHMSHGSIHLFGHLHGNNSPTNGKRMDVAWDILKRPYSFKEITNIMENRPIISDGGHH